MRGEHQGATRADLLRLFEGTSAAALTDGELLGRFVGRGDAAAFEALVDRLGPLVLGVCRRMLADPHDVDDAFQATFLVLVRRAGSIRDRELVAAWLHGVALRIGRRARRDAARRLARERRGVRPEAQEADAGAERSELLAQIDEEIGRLSENHRRPVVLCDVEGLSREEAAARLGWSVNMVRGRLDRARGHLRDRLARRGLAPSGAGMALALPASIPKPTLVAATARAALAFSISPTGAAGLATASALSLSRGVTRMMMFSRWKFAASAALSASVVAAGSGMLAAQGPGPGAASPAVAPGEPRPAPDPNDPPSLEPLSLDVPKPVEAFQPRPAADLAKARVEAAKTRYEAQRAFFEEDRITVDRLINASRGLMEAERDAAESKAAKIAVVQAHHARLKALLKREQNEIEVGRTTSADVEEVRSGLLEAEFALARQIEAPEPKPAAPPVPPVAADDPGDRAARAEPTDLATLGMERIMGARRRLATQQGFYEEGRVTTDRVFTASQALMAAELDVAGDKPSRRAAIRAHLERLRAIERKEEDELRVGRATEADVELARTQRLDAEFLLAKEAAAPAAGPAQASAPKPRAPTGLEKERVEVARRLQANAMVMVQGNQATVADGLAASKTLMEAERDAAESKEGRLAAIRGLVDVARKMLATYEELARRDEKTALDVDQARMGLLDAEISLAREAGEEGVTVEPAPGGKQPTTKPAAGAKAGPRSPLGEAVAAFNAVWSKAPHGQGQPPLTEDEVVAAIRRAEGPMNIKVADADWAEFKQVAETRRVQPGAVFQVVMKDDPGGEYIYDGEFIQMIFAPRTDGRVTVVIPVRSRLERSSTLEGAISEKEAYLRDHPRATPSDRLEAERGIQELKARIEARDRRRKANPS